MANSILAKMAVQITANTSQLNKSLKESSTAVSRFQSSITDAARGLVAGFGALEVAKFTLDVSKLAGEADGVRKAFEKLPQSAKVMRELKEVTGGTVSELELMKRAVTATNFGIQLEQLPKLLEFATVRAQQTGQSVDYLVDSIVTGIGRKSPLILDNLGISTTRLKEQFGGAALEAQSIGDVAAAVGKIAEEELSKMGRMTENAATRMAKYNAEWENLKIAIGNAVNSVDDTKAFTISKMVADLTALFQVLQNNQLANQITEQKGGIFAYLFPNLDQLFSIRELAARIEEVKKNTEELAKINTEGFVKAPTLGAKIQAEINRLTEKNTKQELVKLEALKNQNEERKKSYKLAVQFSEQVRRNQEDEALLGRMNPTFSPMFSEEGGFNIEEFLPQVEEVDSAVQTLTDNLIENAKRSSEAWMNFGFVAGSAITGIINNEENLGRTIANVTADIIASSAKRISAFLGEGIAKAFSINPIAGGAIAAAGLGVITGLLRRVGASGNYRGGGSSYSRVDSGSTRQMAMANVQNSYPEVRIKGQDLYIAMRNYDKYNGYTGG